MRVERVPADVLVPDGNYIGRQSGYQVAHEVDRKAIIWETDVGVRGSCPVQFRVWGGKIIHSSIEQIGDCDGQPLLHGIGA